MAGCAALSWRYDFQRRKPKETRYLRMGPMGLGRAAVSDHHSDLYLRDVHNLVVLR